MQFIQGNSRHQSYFATLEDQVASDNPVRLIDAFSTPGLMLLHMGRAMKTPAGQKGIRVALCGPFFLNCILNFYMITIKCEHKLQREQKELLK